MTGKLSAKMRQRFAGLPATLESHGRDILLVGFFFLLLLVCFIGYWSQKSLQELEDQTRYVQRTDSSRLQTVLKMQEVLGEMEPEVQNIVGAPPEHKLQLVSSRIALNNRKQKLDELFKDAEKGSLGSLQLFKDVETAFAGYWSVINSDNPGQAHWDEERYRVNSAIRDLVRYTQHEREEHDATLLEMSRKARGRIGLATAGVLVVGLVVTGLTFLQIHQIFNRLTKSYAESSDSRDYLRSLFNGLVSGLAVVDLDGTLSSANNVFLSQVAIGPDDPIGASYKKVFSHQPVLAEAITERLGVRGASHRYCGRFEMAEGRQFDAYASPLAIGGETRGLIVVFMDSTEVERAQTELLRNRALSAIGQMTAQVAHEIKNPLGSIGLALDLLRRRGPEKSEEEMQVIDVVDRSVDHLRAIVTELLEFTRPKELRLAPVDLNQLLENLLPMVADRCRSKQISIDKRFSTDIPVVRYDEGELRKLFLNLMINAIDASDQGASVEIGTSVNGSGSIRIDVTDHGCGMDPETLRRLYEPFYTTKAKGTGLGMAIAKRIIELHRGDISILTYKGKGTTVTVQLPINYQSAAAEPRQLEHQAATSQQLG